MLEINGNAFFLQRSREGGAILNLFSVKDEKRYSLNKGSVSETQELIYDLLGINASEILSLIYFSLEKLNVFTNLGASDKHDFLKKISDAYSVDEILVKLTEQFGNLSLKKQEAETEIKVLSKTIDGIKSKTKEETLGTESVEDVIRDTQYEGKKEVLQLIESDLDHYRTLIKDLTDELFSKKYTLQEIKNKSAFLKRSITETKSLLETSLNKIKKIKERKCPECGQLLKDENLLEKHKKDAENRLEEIAKLEEEEKKSVENLPSFEKEIEKLQKKKDKSDKLLSIIQETEQLKQRILLASVESTKTAVLKESTKDLEIKKEDLEESLLDFNRTLGTVKFLKDTVFSRSGSMVQELSKYSGRVLETALNELAGDSKLFEASVDVKKDIDIKVRFKNQNFSVGIGMMSAGQKRFLDILVLLALNKILSNKYNSSEGLLGLAIFDEVFTYLDPEYMETAYSALSNLGTRLKICVTHDERLKSYFDKTITATIRNGYSNYSAL
jgi:DNA repair exonuclease SbcCD ATPase subunit